MSHPVLWAGTAAWLEHRQGSALPFPSAEDLSSHQGNTPGALLVWLLHRESSLTSAQGVGRHTGKHWKGGHTWDASVSSRIGDCYITVSPTS